MELTSTPVSVILDMLETTVKLIMMTAALLLAFMVSSVLCLYFKSYIRDYRDYRKREGDAWLHKRATIYPTIEGQQSRTLSWFI